MEVEALVDFSNWLAQRARDGKRIGLSIEPVGAGYRVAISDGLSWQSGFIEDLDSPLCQILRMQLTTNNGLELVTRSIPATVKALSYVCQLDAKAIAGRFVGDLESLTYTTGIQYPPQVPITADATATLVLWNSAEGRQLPAYLQSVAVPWQRLLCDNTTVIPQVKWRVSYPELLTRVIAFYSHESVLIREAQSHDMLSRLTEALKVVTKEADHEFAYKCLLYTATGYDRGFYEMRFGDPPEVTDEGLDMVIPTVRAMAMTAYQDSAQQGYAQTLYGRRLPIGGQDVATVLWFILGGSVQDIIQVATVTFANNGGYVEPRLWRSDAEHIRIVGTIGRREEPDFTELLAQLAPLTAPLIPVPLNPTVVIE